MTLDQARAKLSATISRLEDSLRRDPILSNPAYLYAVDSVIREGRELLEGIEPGYDVYGAVITEIECIKNLETITSHLDSYADDLASQIARHRDTVPGSGTTTLDARVSGMSRERFNEFTRLGVALHHALTAGNPQTEQDKEQLGLALLMAHQNDPEASATTLAEDAVRLWRATP